MGLIGDQGHTLWTNLRERGMREAFGYAWFRVFYGVHSLPVAWALNRWAPRPRYVEIEITTACDLRCTMCEHTYWDEPAAMMPYERLVYILDQFPRLLWCDLTGIGESLLHPRFLDMVAEVKRRGIYLELYDAFHRWDRLVSDFMVRVGLNRIQPSIDGCTAATYERIRQRAKWETVYRNLDGLFRAKEAARSRLPEVSMHFIVQKSNQHEMGDYVRTVRDLAGRQRVKVQFTELLQEFPEVAGEKYDVPDEQREEVEAVGRACKVGIRWNRKMGRDRLPTKRCTLWHQPFIFVDGSVIRCCTSNEHNARPRQVAHRLGNIFEQSFDEIWNGPQYRRLRRDLWAGTPDAGCEGCPTFGACDGR